MNERIYYYAGGQPTYHGTLGEIRPGMNRWPHLDHEVILSYGLVVEVQDMRTSTPAFPPDAAEPPLPVSDEPPVQPVETSPIEPTSASVDSSPSTRRRGGRHLETDVQKDESTES